jgi:hypothetical protein
MVGPTLTGPRKRWRPFKGFAVQATSMGPRTRFAILDTWRMCAASTLDEVKRGIGHCHAERYASDSDHLGPDVAVEITITPR